MSETFDDAFEKGRKTVHRVEDQWHYPILLKYGFTALTKEATGFVRSYMYERGNHQIKVTTDLQCTNADYWEALPGPCGYWAGLEPYLKTLT